MTAGARPLVLVNLAPSLDGKLAPVRRSGRFTMSRHETDPARMRALRASADAVMIGASNLRADDPDLMPSSLRVVVTRRGEDLDPGARMFNPGLGGEAIVAHAATMSPAARARLARRATLVELGRSPRHTARFARGRNGGPEAVDVLALLEWLGRERGARTVLCEGGGVLVAALLAARAVDRIHLTLVPRILGGATAPTPVAGDGFAPDELPFASLHRCERVGDELFLEYRLTWD